ncbi:hypothetical protein FDV58_24880 [Bradyrhizobium elkanii]|uniref:Uncharacterized protein n=1 Tax=Bradyrhizobium elkanii TaxID=29448 RepID=A0A4U6RX23_BRAEL|nr:hypothetical protein [Bradyrhizobium elkanii]TKV78938.1 hypothetical protein FDV58_24880 [Bradyrhizobium elkanii]
MTGLTRRRDRESVREKWDIFHGDVRVGSIGRRAGVPNHVDQWEWKCGFYPGCDRSASGPAVTFDQARAAFEAAWHALLPTLTEADFQVLARSARLDRAQTGDVGARRKAAFSTAIVADALSLRRDL